MFVDSHCHLDFPELARRTAAAARRDARRARVTHALCIARRPAGVAARASRSRTAHANLYATVGVHPDYADTPEPTVDDAGRAWRATPKVVAIGETGLDYYRLEGDLEWQRERFRTHIRAAREAGKPLVIHTRVGGRRHARDHARGAARARRAASCTASPRRGTSRAAALDLGFHISFSGIVTFKNARRAEGRRAPRAARPDADRDRQPLSRAGAVSRQAQPAGVRAARRARRSRGCATCPSRRSRGATSDNFFRLVRDRSAMPH